MANLSDDNKFDIALEASLFVDKNFDLTCLMRIEIMSVKGLTVVLDCHKPPYNLEKFLKQNEIFHSLSFRKVCVAWAVRSTVTQSFVYP